MVEENLYFSTPLPAVCVTMASAYSVTVICVGSGYPKNVVPVVRRVSPIEIDLFVVFSVCACMSIYALRILFEEHKSAMRTHEYAYAYAQRIYACFCPDMRISCDYALVQSER